MNRAEELVQKYPIKFGQKYSKQFSDPRASADYLQNLYDEGDVAGACFGSSLLALHMMGMGATVDTIINAYGENKKITPDLRDLVHIEDFADHIDKSIGETGDVRQFEFEFRKTFTNFILIDPITDAGSSNAAFGAVAEMLGILDIDKTNWAFSKIDQMMESYLGVVRAYLGQDFDYAYRSAQKKGLGIPMVISMAHSELCIMINYGFIPLEESEKFIRDIDDYSNKNRQRRP